MRLITLEEHYRSPRIRDSAPARGFERAMTTAPDSPIGRRLPKLDAIGEERLADMDGGGIDVQVLSHTHPGPAEFPAEEAVELAQAANDYVADAVAEHPARFAAFATLPMQVPEAAADELERAVKELRMKGALINGHSDGRFLDDRFFWPVLERAQSLGVPIYLHPTVPPAAVRAAYYSNLPMPAAQMLATAGWGWHIETGMHVLRMAIGGVFDEFPGLRLIIGHMGEALPFMLARSSRTLNEASGLRKPLEQYVGEQLWFTTSGMFTFPPLQCLLLVVGADRVMFAVDYPYSTNEDGRDFLERVPISAPDREKIAHGNAERLLGIAPAEA